MEAHTKRMREPASYDIRVTVEMFRRDNGFQHAIEYKTTYNASSNPSTDVVAIKSLKKVIAERCKT